MKQTAWGLKFPKISVDTLVFGIVSAAIILAASSLPGERAAQAARIPSVDGGASGNILDFMGEAASDPLLRALYEPEIRQLADLGSDAYSIYACRMDLDGDGAEEIVSYFLPGNCPGRSGAFHLDIWEEADGRPYNVGPAYAFCPDPRAEGSLFFTGSCRNGYKTLQYHGPDAEGGSTDLEFAYAEGRYEAMVPPPAPRRETESPPPERFDVPCADGQTAAVCKDDSSWGASGEFLYSIHQGKDDSSYSILVSYPDALRDSDERCKVSICDAEGVPFQSFTVDTINSGGDIIQFIDADLDGYADLTVNLRGTMNEEQALYLWDPDRTEYHKVSSDVPLYYFEAYEGYIRNWVRERMDCTVVQDLIWEGETTLVLKSEERVSLG